MKSINNKLAVVTITTFSVFIHLFADGHFSLPLIFLSSTMTILYLISVALGRVKIDKVDVLFNLFIFFMFATALLNIESIRFSTMFYTCMLAYTFLYYKHTLLSGKVSLISLEFISKMLLYAYAITIIFQQFQLYVFHTSVFNFDLSNLDRLSSTIKLNSLAIEASNVPLITMLLIHLYLSIREYRLGLRRNLLSSVKDNLVIWLCLFYTILATASMTSFFVIPVILLRFYRPGFKSSIISVFIVFLAAIYFYFSSGDNSQRLVAVIASFSSFDKSVLIQVDPSSAARLFPFLEYFETFSLINTGVWFGHGNDQFLQHINTVMFGNPDEEQGLGNIFGLLYDYGLIVGFLFFYALVSSIGNKLISYNFFVYISCFSILPINHYVLWTFLILMYTTYFVMNQLNSVLPFRETLQKSA